MTIREQIIKELDVTPEYQGLYYSLKLCLKTNDGILDSSIDNWFRGIVESLFYKPNHYLLILEGKENFDNFFIDLMPERLYFIYSYNNQFKSVDIYYSLIKEISFDFKKQQDIIEEDNFIVIEENAKQLIEPGTDKRMCSYCSTTDNWSFPQRKNVIVLHLESVDWEKYKSIDKLQLWREIFFKFKPKL